MDYQYPDLKPKPLPKALQPLSWQKPKKRCRRTCKGRVVYDRREHYFSWMDFDRIFYTLELPTIAAVALRGSDEFKKYYVILDLWLQLGALVGDMYLDNPVYLDGFLRTEPNTGWRGSRQRALRDRIRAYLQIEEFKLIIKTVKDYFDTFKRIASFDVSKLSIKSFNK